MAQILADTLKLVVVQEDDGSDRAALEERTRMIPVLQQEEKSLFGIEYERRQILLSAIERANRDVASLKKSMSAWEHGYRQWIPFEPLTWRKPQALSKDGLRDIVNLPSLAIFSLENADMMLYHNNQLHENFVWPFPSDRLNTELHRIYRDVELSLRQYRSIGMIYARFSGTIPLETKKKILEVSKLQIFDAIYLLAEVEAWSIQNHTVPLKRDPLVVGYNDFHSDRFWYIDSFDITPLENQIPISF